MDLARNLLLISSLFLFSACSESPEKRMIYLLENKYSNLYVNGEGSKRHTIEKLKNYFDEKEINEQNLKEIQQIVSTLGDGHVSLNSLQAENAKDYVSGLKFIPGSTYVESCESCVPEVKKGKYKLISVDGVKIETYLQQEEKSVNASTDRGREFRIFKKLEENKKNEIKKIVVRDRDFHQFETTLNWRERNIEDMACVTSERLNENTVRINILNLWCREKADHSEKRATLIQNFSKQLEKSLEIAKVQDSFILDLRENNGGGDEEVEIILNTFINKSVQMYKYKVLKSVTLGKKSWLKNLFSSGKDLWHPVEYQYSNLKNKTKYNFFDNKLIVLISPGCFSSCEGLASILKLEERALIIGGQTHGGAGGPIDYPLGRKSLYSLTLPAGITWQKNDLLYEGEGVMPDVRVHQDLSTLKDTVLDEAIYLIQ